MRPTYVAVTLACLLAACTAARAQDCSLPPFSICVAATQPSSPFQQSSDCQSLLNTMKNFGVPMPQQAPVTGGSPMTCSSSMPSFVKSSVPSPDPVFFLCLQFNFMQPYRTATSAVWSLSMPSPQPGFSETFEGMYTRAASSTSHTRALFSYFTCRPRQGGSLPLAATEGAWQLQYMKAGNRLSPPPPPPSVRSVTSWTSASATKTLGFRRQLQQADACACLPSGLWTYHDPGKASYNITACSLIPGEYAISSAAKVCQVSNSCPIAQGGAFQPEWSDRNGGAPGIRFKFCLSPAQPSPSPSSVAKPPPSPAPSPRSSPSPLPSMPPSPARSPRSSPSPPRPPPPFPPAGVCRDSSIWCPTLAANNGCSSDPTYMSQSCCFSCLAGSCFPNISIPSTSSLYVPGTEFDFWTCRAECQSNANCASFSFSSGWCLLAGSPDTSRASAWRTNSSVDTLCFYRTNEARFKYYCVPNFDVAGVSEAPVKYVSDLACSIACDNMSACSFFSWTASTNSCSLRSSPIVLDGTNQTQGRTTRVSGTKVCFKPQSQTFTTGPTPMYSPPPPLPPSRSPPPPQPPALSSPSPPRRIFPPPSQPPSPSIPEPSLPLAPSPPDGTPSLPLEPPPSPLDSPDSPPIAPPLSPPGSPPSTPPSTPLDTAIINDFSNVLGLNVTGQPPDAPLDYPDLGRRMLLAPYLNPDFVSEYLEYGYDSAVATNTRNFVNGGGVLLILASSNTDMSPEDSCSAPVQLLQALFGSSTLDGCSCGQVGTSMVAKMSSAAVLSVMGSASGPLLAAEGRDFLLDVSLVGGLPLTCPDPGSDGSPELPMAYDMVKMYYNHYENTVTTASGKFMRISDLRDTPAGYRLATCSELLETQERVLPLTSYLDACRVDGGWVTGVRTDSYDDGRYGYRIDCSNSDIRPMGYTCAIITNASSVYEPAPSAPLPPSPPVDVAPAPIMKIDMSTDIPAGYRQLTCQEAQENVDLLRPIVSSIFDICFVEGGVVRGAQSASSTVVCDGPRPPAYSCMLVTSSAITPATGSSLVKAWPQGSGWVVWVGAGIVPEDLVFPYSYNWDDRNVWRAMMTGFANMAPHYHST